MLKEFKQFVLRGNVLDLAVAVVIGAAFGKIVGSFVGDIIMPPLGLLLGRINMTDLALKLADGKDGKPVLLKYGSFLQSVFDFLIIAFAVFLLVKLVTVHQKLRKQEEPPPPVTKTCPECAMDIPVKARKCGHCQSALA